MASRRGAEGRNKRQRILLRSRQLAKEDGTVASISEDSAHPAPGQQKARWLPQALHSPLSKELSSGVRQHPNAPAGTHLRGHAPHPRRHTLERTDARDAALSAIPPPPSLQRMPDCCRRAPRASPPPSHSFRLSQPRRKCPGKPPTMRTCVMQLGVDGEFTGSKTYTVWRGREGAVQELSGSSPWKQPSRVPCASQPRTIPRPVQHPPTQRRFNKSRKKMRPPTRGHNDTLQDEGRREGESGRQ